MAAPTNFVIRKRDRYLVEPPSVTEQTDWPCGFFALPAFTGGQPCVHFNPAIVHWLKADWLITRTQTNPSRNRVHSRLKFWLLTNKHPGDESEIYISGAFHDEHAEDPRAFVDEHDRLFLSWTAWRYSRPGLFAHQVCGYVNHELAVSIPMHIPYGKNGLHLHQNKGYEKNWIHFFDERGLHFVYTMQPHLVCDVENGVVVKTHPTAGAQGVWNYGEQRGGTPPVKVGNEYFSFFHSSVDWKAPYRRYMMGCYAFSAEPPYDVTGITTYPLLFGSLVDPRPSYGGPLVTFPCGALFRDDKWLVTLGVNDCRSAWIEIPHEELTSLMVQV